MARLRIERVSSASRLSGALLPGEVDDYGSFDGHILELDDPDLADELASHHNVEVVSKGVNPGVTATETEETTYACGVNGCSRKVESETDVCWQHGD